MHQSTRSIAVMMIAGTLLLSACGGGSDAEPSEAASSGESAEVAEFNEADVLFAQGMIPHHAQAVEMAGLALAPEAGASADIVELATAIQSGQEPEIVKMTAWLQQWGQPMEMPGMDGMEGMDEMEGMEGMDGMMTAEQMASLAGLSGPAFNSAWATMMIAHHEGAVAQAEAVLANGADPVVRALAEQIIAAQRGEINQMEAMLGG